MKYTIAWLFGLVLPLSVHTQQLPDSVSQKLKAGIAGFMERYHSPSMAIAVVHNNSIVFSDAQGYVDLENKISASIDYPYPILSVTKVSDIVP